MTRTLLSFPKPVMAMVTAVHQTSAEYTAIFTVRIVEHRPPSRVVTIHKTCTDLQWNVYQKVNVLATHQTL